MTERTIKISGPDHPIVIEPNPGRVIVTLGLPHCPLGLATE